MHRVLLYLLIVIAYCQAESAAAQSLVHGELLYVAPSLYDSPENSDPRTEQQRKQAEQLVQQARDACDAGEIGMSLQLATRVLHFDPNNAVARRVLGYRRIGSHWAGSYAARRLERDELWDERFGWIRAEELPRWETGERKDGKRWLTVAEDERLHSKIDKGWQIRTDHFLVTTNDSRQAAAEMATRLETLYQLWQQMFGGFYLQQEALTKRFEGHESSGYRSRPFQVTYYRSRQEYNSSLLRKQPQIAMTLGIYFDNTRMSYFFAGPEQDAGTIYHEAVHQLFQESRPAARNVGALANAWLVEGIACYFESLSEHHEPQLGHFYTLGTPSAGRLPAARHRRLVDDYYVPLAELSALGTADLQRRSDIARLYSQSAGLATFLVHYQDGVYRPALVTLLQLIYKGRDKVDSLEQLTGQSFEQLDNEYEAYLRSLPE